MTKTPCGLIIVTSSPLKSGSLPKKGALISVLTLQCGEERVVAERLRVILTGN
jgi:hypothetical protein